MGQGDYSDGRLDETPRFDTPCALPAMVVAHRMCHHRSVLSNLPARRPWRSPAVADVDAGCARQWMVEMMGDDDERAVKRDDIVGTFGRASPA